MKLYHGTNVDFSEIDFSKSRDYKDFGKGFYLTDIRSQAEQLAQKRAMIMGGKPIVQEYEIDENILVSGDLNVLRFLSPTAEWAQFVFNNRRRSIPPYCHSYDIVIGPIADDGVAYLLSRYEEGSFTIEELAKQLEFKQLNSQYFFGTQKAAGYLKRML